LYIAPPDRTFGEDEWRPFVEAQAFGHLVAPGAGLEYPVVVPTQFVLDGAEVLVHFAKPNPVLDALEANPRALLSVAGDWAFIPSSWKAIGEEDASLGIPTTYYAAVQLKGHAEVKTDPQETADVLRRQLAVFQPSTPIADPLVAHLARLGSIRAVVLGVEEVAAKFKYGGNVDVDHRTAVIEQLRSRGGTGDRAAAAHAERRLSLGSPTVRQTEEAGAGSGGKGAGSISDTGMG
jgi:transcriptional regulator